MRILSKTKNGEAYSQRITAFIFSHSSVSKPDTANEGFEGLDASPMRTTTILSEGITYTR